MRQSIFLVLSLCIISSCKNKKPLSESLKEGNTGTKTEQTETLHDEEGLIVDEFEEVASHNLPNKKGYKTLHSLRYHFAIDIPETWFGKDKSGNGDGFYISIPNVETEISVYGESAEADIIEMYNSMCTELTDYTFGNGFTGTKCSTGKEITYSQIAKKTIISAYIKDITVLTESEKAAFEEMVNSLRFFSNDELKS